MIDCECAEAGHCAWAGMQEILLCVVKMTVAGSQQCLKYVLRGLPISFKG